MVQSDVALDEIQEEPIDIKLEEYNFYIRPNVTEYVEKYFEIRKSVYHHDN